MKKAFSILLTVIIIGQNLVCTCIAVYFYANHRYIAGQLCENRDKPQMHCNGQCYLAKQLQKAEKNENRTAQLIKLHEEMVFTELRKQVAVYIPPLLYSCDIVPVDCRYYGCAGENSLIKPPIAGC